jgi:hypothetical protein
MILFFFYNIDDVYDFIKVLMKLFFCFVYFLTYFIGMGTKIENKSFQEADDVYKSFVFIANQKKKKTDEECVIL